jgi:signal transduction histidine kinase/ABC-type uncharacterized transport system substrate-binding protein
MGAIRLRKTCVVVVLGLFVLVSVHTVDAAEAKQKHKRILIVYPQEMRTPGELAADRGIRAVLGDKLDVELYSEHLHQYLFPDERFQAEQLDWFRNKYQNQSIDLVITAGTILPNFLPGVPVVFCCVEATGLPTTKLPANVTGTWLTLDFMGTVEAARRLQPKAQQVVVLSGTTAWDRQVETGFRKAMQGVTDLQFSYWDNLPVPVIREHLAKLSRNTIVIYLSIESDVTGQVFIPRDLLPSFTKASLAPIYGLSENFIGFGVVGGSVINLEHQGREVAQIALRVLGGEKPSDIPPTPSSSEFIFDWRQLHRFGLRESALPSGSTVKFRVPSVWELYWKWIAGSVTLILLQTSFILYLLLQRRRRARAEHFLEQELRFETLLSELSATFSSLPAVRVDAEIAAGLGRLRLFLELDRISLFEHVDGETQFVLSHSSSVDGVPPAPRAIGREQFPWLVSSLLKGDDCVIQSVQDCPPEAAKECAFLLEGKYKFTALIPLQTGGSILGSLSFVSFKEHDWPKGLVQQLKIVAEVFANAIVRKRAGVVLEYSESLKDAILVSLNSNVAVLDQYGTILSVNQKWIDMEYIRGAYSGAHFSAGMNYLKKCRELAEVGSPFARVIADGISTVLSGGRENFELEYSCIPPNEDAWFLISVTPLRREAGGAVITHKDITERKRDERHLLELSGRLINAQEDERARIARELHDDFSQRLALMAMELEQLSQTPAASDHAVIDRLHMVWERITELSSDIHRLSHRLHSSKLQYVGLLAAAKSLCDETARKHHIQIEFVHHDMPETISPDIALCFFRIVQEALNNIVKHSGAKQVRIEFSGAFSTIRLRIVDAGVGFDPGSRTARGGLGLASMRERLRLIGGSIAIHSVHMEGTEIVVEAPGVSPSAENHPRNSERHATERAIGEMT